MPVFKVIVKVETFIQHDLFISFQQTKSQVCEGLVRSERVVKFADVRRQVLESRLFEYGAVISQICGFSAVQVDLCVVGLCSAG